MFEAAEQLLVQAVGNRCRDASLSSQLCRGEMSAQCSVCDFYTVSSSDVQSVFLLPLQFLLCVTSNTTSADCSKYVTFFVSFYY